MMVFLFGISTMAVGAIAGSSLPPELRVATSLLFTTFASIIAIMITGRR